MEKILEQIVEADRQARERVNERRRRLETINDEIACAAEEIDSALKEKAALLIEKTREEAERKKQAETERIDKYFADTEEKLNRAYNENSERWVNEIFSDITK